MQNLVILMGPSEEACEVSLKVGNMCLNLFANDEEAAFELSGIHYLKETSDEMINGEEIFQRESKDKGYLSHLKLTHQDCDSIRVFFCFDCFNNW